MSENQKFSVIIPTLQQAGELHHLVESCSDHPLVLEVIVVNNAPEPLHWTSPKVKVLQQEENIFVNPAWNLGAKVAGGEYLALINDDVLVDPILFDQGARWLKRPGVGILGMDRTCTGPNAGKPWMRPVYERPEGFGTVMLMRRDRFVEIPEDLLIWCGDDWLFSRQKHRNWIFGDIPIKAEAPSVTSSQPVFSPIKETDLINYRGHGDAGYGQRFAIEKFILKISKKIIHSIKG